MQPPSYFQILNLWGDRIARTMVGFYAAKNEFFGSDVAGVTSCWANDRGNDWTGASEGAEDGRVFFDILPSCDT